MSEDPWGYLDQLFRRLAAHLDVQVYLHHQPRPEGNLQLVAQRGLSDEVAGQLSALSFDHAVFGAAASERRAMSIEDVQQSSDPRAQALRGLGVSAFVCHPLVGRSGLLGTVAFGSRTRRTFDAEALALIWAVCDQVVVAVDRMRGELALREADRRKDEFLAMLAHELRNPLAAIHSAVQLVMAQAPQEPTRSAAEIVKRQLAHLTHLIDDLLDVARITQGKIKLEKGRIELHDAIEQALETSRPIIASRQHRLEVQLPPQAIWVNGDRTRLAQVLSNLLSNAAKYTDPGGTVALILELQDQCAVVRVRDTGIGIAPEMLPCVFELFTQASPELDRAQGGLGVGLTLARALMRLHGGELVAHSEGVGRGSEFVLTLPLAEEAPASPTPSAAGNVGRTGPPRVLRILVVDDNQDAAHTMAMLLRLDGHHVETAYDGPEALEAASRFRPDVILLDLGLPGLTGFEVARRLREQTETRDVRLIALTGYGQEEDRRQTQEAGFDSHLVKPVDKGRLDEALFVAAR